MVKREALIDKVRNRQAMKPGIVALRRTSSSGSDFLSRYMDARVINTRDGMLENRSQALLDLCIIRERKDKGITGRYHLRHNTQKGSAVSHNRPAEKGSKMMVSGPPSMILAQVESFGVQVARSCAGSKR